MNITEMKKLAKQYRVKGEELKERAILNMLPDDEWKLNRVNAMGGVIPEQFQTLKKELLWNPALGHWKNQLSHLSAEGMDNIFYLINRIIKDNIVGDFLEAGVFRRGACIFARKILNYFNQNHRNVWLCDSFEGFPDDAIEFKKWPHIQNFYQNIFQETLVQEISDIKKACPNPSLEEVQQHFKNFNLLDDTNENVKFIKGFFNQTLPTLSIEKIAILRIDCDFYQSVLDVLNTLYHKVSSGGFIIIDDYGPPFQGCINAVNEFRDQNNIIEPMITIGGEMGQYWRKQ